MQAVAFCTASLSAMLWIQKWMFPSSKIPEPSNELSIMHGVGDTMDCIRTCTWLLCGSIHTPWIAQLILPSVVDMVLHMKNEISCTTAVLLHHYQGTVTVVPRHYHSTTRTLLLRYHGTTRALLLHYHDPTTVLPGTIAALPQHYQGTVAALPLHTAGRDTVTCSPAGHCDEDSVACREERFHAAPSPGMTTHSFVGCEHNRHWMYAWRVSSLQTTASGVFSTRLYVVVLVVAFFRWTLWQLHSICRLGWEDCVCAFSSSSSSSICPVTVWGSHSPSSKDLSPLLEGGCCYARGLLWLKIVPTWLQFN